MIHLASDPTSRMNWQAPSAEDKGQSLQARRARSGHAWPFISRRTDKPSGQEQTRQPASQHGS
ncbi:hypothetical protein [Ramlibacter sp.]|uniref:hypothetical protein n=1 Tax=Ramlibacter sp. TaxID=1917967 RepID=UPI00183C688C|nr:hypothetical protein [Ramlibacter sp.]MBA2676244.1 hypothetical protein [Ramlibacter sp.]